MFTARYEWVFKQSDLRFVFKWLNLLQNNACSRFPYNAWIPSAMLTTLSNNLCLFKIFIIRNKEINEGLLFNFVCFWCNSPQWARVSSFTRFIDHTQRHISVSRTSRRVIRPSQSPLPNNTQHSQQTNIHAPGGIRTHNLSRRAANGTGFQIPYSEG